MNFIFNYASNPTVIVIIAVTLYVYFILLNILAMNDEDFLESLSSWKDNLRTLVSLPPLLGLLGTISGIFQAFYGISVNTSLDYQEIVSQGISEAMITTQLGILSSIPGWIILSLLERRKNRIIALQSRDH